MSAVAGNRVVVTGLGVVACNGEGVRDFWAANVAGRSGVTAVTGFPTDDLSSRVAGQIHGFDPSRYMPVETVKRVDRFVHFGLACAEMALAESRLVLASEDPTRIGVVIGSGLGGILFHEQQIVDAVSRNSHRMHPIGVPKVSPNAVAGHIGIRYGLQGPNMVISTACASGSHGIGEAFRKVKYGEVDVCVTGGVEAPLSPFTLGAYGAMRVLTKNNENPAGASRPFDLNRDGFVLGEGGAILILEERGRALARGATILAEIIGYASNSGAHHMVMPDATGSDAARVMVAAMKEAGVARVDYINAHATSTKANDAAETLAIKQVFGADAARIPVSSTKSMIGHTLGAAGAIEAVVCVKALQEGFVPPTINLETPDPACDLDYVPNVGRKHRLRYALSNSFGFGNCNAALVFSSHLP